MSQSICILGRQPELGLVELESLLGPSALTRLSSSVALVNQPVNLIPFERLGGTIKLAELSEELNFNNWDLIESYILKNLDRLLPATSNKLTLGLSTYGFNKPLNLNKLGLKIKTHLKKLGQSMRYVQNNETALNSAQVNHNRLTGPSGVELLIINAGSKTYVAKTIKEQNITSYTKRDRGRPARDPKIGMLPPKLAQILINLANPAPGETVLDPFCGTGVVLQEAALMNFKVYGSDLEPKCVEYTKRNLNWAEQALKISNDWRIEVGDATKHQWSNFDCVVSETYLGQAFSAYPNGNLLESVVHACNKIATEFLKNIHDQLGREHRLVITLPAWYNPSAKQYMHLPLLDQIESLGYNRLSFVHGGDGSLIYHRSDQIVAREIITLVRKS